MNQLRSWALDSTVPARQLFVEKGFEATSLEDIARLSQTSKGAVYHHFPDKREIFAEVFKASELAVIQAALQSMPTKALPGTSSDRRRRRFSEPTLTIPPPVRCCDIEDVLGWERVRAIDEEAALPMIRASLSDVTQTGHSKFPVATAAELLFGLYCNGILHIAGSDDPKRASKDVETVIFTMLKGLQAESTPKEAHQETNQRDQ